MIDSDSFSYIGQELDIFAHACRWKAYWASRIRRWVIGDVLEVGAGLGVNTILLQNKQVTSWQCLEPDPELAATLTQTVAAVSNCSVRRGTVASMAGSQFDSILYIDVLEHIEADREELAQAAKLLRLGGCLVVLSPAHQFLYSNFDAAIGHYRRYNKASLRRCTPADCEVEGMFYLDCAGVLASLANRLMLRQSDPTLRQILTWDNYIVPISRLLDPASGYMIGKTIVGVWRRVHASRGSAVS